jgi:hypothetical protein
MIIAKEEHKAAEGCCTLTPSSYSDAHESCAGEVSFPRESLHDIPGSLFTESGRRRRTISRLQKGKGARERSHCSGLQTQRPFPPRVPPSCCFSQHALATLRN